MLKIAIFSIILILAGLAISCSPTQTDRVYDDNIDKREKIFLQAQSLYPQPIPSDFPVRRDLVEYTLREAKPGPWYIYIQTDVGTYSAYYVAKSKPQNACNFLSSTKIVTSIRSINVETDAPSLDGVYYGGTGASGACDSWFWFDAGTNALIETRFKFTVSDQPLAIDVPRILVQLVK